MPHKPLALISGANKGIGYEVAGQLARKGYTVLLGARDAQRGEAAAAALTAESLDVQYVALDLADEQTIEALAAHITKTHGDLDVLVNNAGIADMNEGPASAVAADTLRRILDTNFFHTVALTQAMLPLLRKASAARIVNVSSGLGSMAQNADPNWPFAAVKPLGYNGSKALLNMFTIHLAAELRDTAIKVNSADPGYTKTDLNNNSGFQTVAEGSEAIVHLATLPPDGPTGGYFDRHGMVPW